MSVTPHDNPSNQGGGDVDPTAYEPPSTGYLAPPLDGVGGITPPPAAGAPQPGQGVVDYGAFPPPVGDPYPGVPYPGAPNSEAPYSGAPNSDTPSSGGAYPGQPYGAMPPAGQPYGAVPPAGQPYPGPDQPGQPYPYAPQQYPPGQLPPRKGRKRGRGRLISLIVLAVMIAGGSVVGYLRSQSSPQNARVGDCIHYASESDNTVVDCNSDQAQYRVERRVDSSSKTACDSVDDADVTLYSMDNDKHPFTLCVSLVLRVGSCVSEEGDVVACTEPSARARVTSVHAGSTDPAVCGSDEIPRVYRSDPRVVCLAEIV